MQLMRPPLFDWIWLCWIWGFLSFCPKVVSGEDLRSLPKSDAAVLNELLGEAILDSSAESVWLRAQSLPEADRLEALARWVFPPRVSTPPRLGLFYTAYDRDAAHPGGQSHSVAEDFVEAAIEANQAKRIFDELDQRDSPPAFRCQTIRTLLALKTKSDDLAEQLDAFFESLPQPEDRSIRPPDDLLVVLKACGATGESGLAAIGVEIAGKWLKLLEQNQERPAWHRHLSAIAADLEWLATERDSTSSPAEEALTYWRPASRSRARERGLGFPPATWSVENQTVQNHISHDDDMLFFTIPILGEYEVEGELGGFGFRDTSLMTGNRYVGLIYDHRNYQEGIARGPVRRTAFTPELTDTFGDAFLRYRTWVTNDFLKTSINGRVIRNVPQEAWPAPWIGIASTSRHRSTASDVRITGKSGRYTIPDTVNMCDSFRLPEWIEYFAIPERSELVHWRQRDRGEDNGASEIIGLASKDQAKGSFDESLLMYSRPMFEDGVIRYQFMYQPDQVLVHPALGDLSFVLADDGIHVHRITHGRYERLSSELRPDNKVLIQSNQRGPGQLPLIAGQWNQMQMAVTGDTLSLTLNEELVYEQTLPEYQRRVFGLFHYRDQTEARVREVSWTGQWPKELPALGQQGLAVIPEDLTPAGSQKLSEQVTIDLRSDQLLSEQAIRVAGGYDREYFNPTNDGLRIKRIAKSGYQTSSATPNLRVGGDFDVTIVFEDLASEAALGKTATLMLELNADSPTQDRASLQLKIDRENERVIQCLDMQIIEGTERRHYFGHQPQDNTAGSLRISRRGDQVYYLIAENDSEQFALVGQAAYSTEDLPAGDIKFGCQIQGEAGFCEARFTTLDVRAERLSGLAIRTAAEVLADLNQHRGKLKDSVQVDFNTTSPDSDSFYRWGQRPAWKANQGGLKMEAIGAQDWVASGIAIREPAIGNFDVSIDMDQIELSPPLPGKHTQHLLQLEFADAAVRKTGIIKGGNTQCGVILTRYPSGSYAVEAQTRLASPDGGYDYRTLAAVPVKSATSLRIARRDTTLFFIATVIDLGPNQQTKEILIAEFPIGTVQLDSYGVKVLIHAGGLNVRAESVLQSISIHGDSFSLGRVQAAPELRPIPVPDRTPPANAKPKSLLQSLFDLF